jgi:hypothetical protein
LLGLVRCKNAPVLLQDVTHASSQNQVTLDPELVQRAINKLQNRIINLEREREAQNAFNEKQAALIPMLLERVTQVEKRLR